MLAKSRIQSHPTWVRGLKQELKQRLITVVVSHPTWVRGLKPIREDEFIETEGVAPYVGAWIETRLLMHSFAPHAVAPYVGAWIETTRRLSLVRPLAVAPYVGAWIETGIDRFNTLAAPCRTLRGCVD